MQKLQLSDFYYDLPKELIAQTPLTDRSSSKLMVLDRKDNTITHKTFKDITEYINEGDCLVLNNTRVLPARLYGIKKGTGAHIEFLLLKRISDTVWEIMVKPGKRAKIGTEVVFGDGLLCATILSEDTESGLKTAEFHFDGIFEEILDKLGEMPLPPYITEKLQDKERYQTVYSKNIGSAAAPTAGLHFTDQLLKELADKGVKIAFLTLHVGLGTFRPVKVKDITTHKMHSEFFEIDKEACNIINETKKSGKKVFCVGTTSTRTLESVADDNGFLTPKSGWTDIFIYPGYKFKIVDNLITNFHLPESTLLMLVSALYDRQHILKAYTEAVNNNYRFFSFGDAMLIN
ncbi:MAG: tRNA preQ1(34) S-adenosylmethionine ribosyltransferase-isomerase QueA [Clostridia bacterium]|nr:tRNA preQ1(34) S-adenosylmethionine ribosyltransferase-isomerase QueA [Clostridia bacterium]